MLSSVWFAGYSSAPSVEDGSMQPRDVGRSNLRMKQPRGSVGLNIAVTRTMSVTFHTNCISRIPSDRTDQVYNMDDER